MRGMVLVNKLGGIWPAASFEKSMTTGWPGPGLAPQPQNSSIRPLGRSNPSAMSLLPAPLVSPLPGSGPSSGTDLPSLACGSNQWSRSEEHTSELQSLMRISYAVFCLKKQNNQDVT